MIEAVVVERRLVDDRRRGSRRGGLAARLLSYLG
jgi:hypothetical protein